MDEAFFRWLWELEQRLRPLMEQLEPVNRAMEAHARSLEPLEEYARQAERLISRLEPAALAFERTASQLDATGMAVAERAREIEALLERSGSTAALDSLVANAERFTALSSFPELARVMAALEASQAGITAVSHNLVAATLAVSDRLNRSLPQLDASTVAAAISSFVEANSERLTAAQRAAVGDIYPPQADVGRSRQWSAAEVLQLIQILLALWMIVYPPQTALDEAEIIAAVEAAVSSLAAPPSDIELPLPLFTVDETVQLCAAPSDENAVLTVPAGTKLQILGADGEWAYVQALGTGGQSLGAGWLLRARMHEYD